MSDSHFAAQRPAGVCRLIDDLPHGGAWNMAVDDVLLEAAATTGQASLRFYRWSEPTLSLGYFQAHDDRLAHHASRQSAVVRRSSGGGAILHDRELTYSLALPGGGGLAGDSSRLYAAAHEALIEVLADLDIVAALCQPPSAPATAEQPFLCFLRHSAGDVLAGEAKICGSAQRRRQAAILQHGSLILGRSLSAPELPGLAELSSIRPSADELVSAWSKALGQRLNLRLAPCQLEPAGR